MLDSCDEGYLSCDGAADNGCEHAGAACGGCDEACDAPKSAGEPAPAPPSDAGRQAPPADIDAGGSPADENADAGVCAPERCAGRDNDCDDRTDEADVCCVSAAATGQGETCDRCVCQRCSNALGHCRASGNAEWDASCSALLRCFGTSMREGRCSGDDVDCAAACASEWWTAGWRPNRSCNPDQLSVACDAFMLVRQTCYETKCDMACKH